MTQKLTERQEAWVKALQSGKYKQGGEFLCQEKKFCCLGVACEIAPEFKDYGSFYEDYSTLDPDEDEYAPPEIVEALKLHSKEGLVEEEHRISFFKAMESVGYRGPQRNTLASYNDSYDATFKQIAAAIRKVPQAIFTSDETN